VLARLERATEVAFWFTTVGAVGRGFALPLQTLVVLELRPLRVTWPALRFSTVRVAESRLLATPPERLLGTAALPSRDAATLAWLARAAAGSLPLLLEALGGLAVVVLADRLSTRLTPLAEEAWLTLEGCLPSAEAGLSERLPRLPRVDVGFPLGGGGRFPFGGGGFPLCGGGG
jgi:hypothetical protein